MDLENLRAVRLVAEQGSFAAVARLLEVDPSTVSRAVTALEAELGLRLFQRSTRRLSVTEAGAAWLRRAGPALDELSAARDEAARGAAQPQGTLRLTASVAFGHEVIVPLLARFRQALPGIALELLLSDANLDLIGEALDLAIRLAPAPQGDLISTRLMRTRYRVVAAPAYLAREGALTSAAELSQRDCLLTTLPDYRTRWLVRRAEGAEEVPVRGTLRISNALALRRAAREGLGPALLADWLIGRDLSEGRLIDLLPEDEVTATTFDTGAWALYPSRAFLPVKVRATLDFLRSALSRS